MPLSRARSTWRPWAQWARPIHRAGLSCAELQYSLMSASSASPRAASRRAYASFALMAMLVVSSRRRLVSRPPEYVRFARTRLLTRAALIRAATVRERSAQRTELRGHDTRIRAETGKPAPPSYFSFDELSRRIQMFRKRTG